MWAAYLRNVQAQVAQQLVTVNEREFVRDNTIYQRNLKTLQLLGKLPPTGEPLDKKYDHAMKLLELAGWSDWRGKSIIIAVQEELPMRHQNLAALVWTVSTLVKSVFLSSKPAQPAQSRWTGVPQVSCWCLSLVMFYDFFGAIMTRLQQKYNMTAANVMDLLESTMDADEQIASSQSYQAQQVTRRNLLWKWSCAEYTGVNLFLVVVANAPVRRLLHYILKYELAPHHL
ncbi:unnamed protein product [Polarella glacialis]|uniref:Uncharacterized protein n=1 Tax=Polarella glacialis TaxID=89957 RepID=A0A813D449_POLGL|nr:unnamed protein product [Polarella glacialis]